MPASHRGRNGVLLFLIQSAHSLVFLVLSAGILYVVYSAIVNRVTWWTKAAIGSVIVEGVVLILSGWRCPLRIWAEALGAERGSVTDIFLPRWLADRIFTICTPLFVTGCLALVVRRLYARRSTDSGTSV